MLGNELFLLKTTKAKWGDVLHIWVKLAWAPSINMHKNVPSINMDKNVPSINTHVVNNGTYKSKIKFGIKSHVHHVFNPT